MYAPWLDAFSVAEIEAESRISLGGGVYVIHRGVSLRRVGGVDPLGILYIGKAASLLSRLKQFLRGGHTANSRLWANESIFEWVIAFLQRIEEAENPPQRYEHAYAARLLHVDAKRFGKIRGIGHAIHGHRRKRSQGVGWEVVFVCVDDYTRQAYAEVHPSENAVCATKFFSRALRWFESLGIRCERLMTDNAKCYASKAFTALCGENDIRQLFTKPYTPQTNGKAERFIQTLKRRWAYRRAYRTSALRADSLRPWVKHYNHHRPHRALGKIPPMARLRASCQ